MFFLQLQFATQCEHSLSHVYSRPPLGALLAGHMEVLLHNTCGKATTGELYDFSEETSVKDTMERSQEEGAHSSAQAGNVSRSTKSQDCRRTFRLLPGTLSNQRRSLQDSRHR
jgi:hypothetical protein